MSAQKRANGAAVPTKPDRICIAFQRIGSCLRTPIVYTLRYRLVIELFIHIRRRNLFPPFAAVAAALHRPSVARTDCSMRREEESEWPGSKLSASAPKSTGAPSWRKWKRAKKKPASVQLTACRPAQGPPSVDRQSTRCRQRCTVQRRAQCSNVPSEDVHANHHYMRENSCPVILWCYM